MFTTLSRLRRCVAGFVLAASVVLGGCATYPDSYYYDDARYDGGDYYYDEPYRAVDYYEPYWPGGYYYSALWPIYSRWYDPFYYPSYYYGVTYFPRSWYGFSLSYFDHDPWWRSHHYSPYRYSWYDNYYSWNDYGRRDRIGRHDYNRYSSYRFGSARAETERLAARTRQTQSAFAGAGTLQRPFDPSYANAAERQRVREAGGRGRDVFADDAGTARYGASRAASTAPARESGGYRYDGRPTGDARRPATDSAYEARGRMPSARARDAQAPITRDDARYRSAGEMQRAPRGWSAGPREDSPVDRSAYRSRGLPDQGQVYRERNAYGRANDSGYAAPRTRSSERSYESPTRVYSRGRDEGYAAPRGPERDDGSYQAPARGYAAPSRGAYAAPQGGYEVRGREAPSRGSYAAPSGGGYSAPARSSGGWSAPAPSAPSRSDSGSDRSSDRDSSRSRDRDE